MGKSIISEGKTSTEAIEKGLKELKVSKDQVEIKVIEEKKKSFFSILDPHIVKVEIIVKEGVDAEKTEKMEKKNFDEIKVNEETLDQAKCEVEKFLKKLLKNISDKIQLSTSIENGTVIVEINGEGSAKLIGYRGEALNALQIIISGVIKNKIDDPVRIVLDVEGYRNKREKTLEELAMKLEKTVMKNGKSIKLEPMTPYERKIIHTTLQDSNYVKTYSIGEGDHRRLVVSKK